MYHYQNPFSWEHSNIVVKILVFTLPISFFLFFLCKYCATSRSTATSTTEHGAQFSAPPPSAPPSDDWFSAPTPSAPPSDVRMDHQVLASLPTFFHSSMGSKSKMECPVCLMEFKDGEECRLLPNCLHRFHVGCIDMWFVSHSTCPICRTIVQSQMYQESII